MKKVFLKSTLLLCALTVGSLNVWGTDIATWGQVSIAASTAIIASGGDANNNGKAQFISTKAMTSKGSGTSKCYYGSSAGGATITFSNLDLSGYSNISMTFYSRSSSSANFTVTTSSDGKTYSACATVSVTSSEGKKTVSNIPNTAQYIKLVHGASSGSLYFGTINISGTPPSFSVTAVSNNNAYGTVSGSTTITATPANGYRVIAGDGGYTVKSGAASVLNNGNNTFTVTPTSDCTVQINFEAIPTHVLSGVVSPAASGTITLSSTSVGEGATATATAVAEAGHKFTGWSISGTGATVSSTTTNPTTVTMGTADATITATFVEVTTHPIHWSVNGSVVRTDNVEENTAISFPTSISGIPTGYVLKGWVVEANKISGTQSTAPSYAPAANATAETTYYAVMAYAKIESAETVTLTAGSSWSGYADKTFKDDKNNSWTANCTGTNQSGTIYYGIKAETTSYFKSPTFTGIITGIDIWGKNGSSTEDRTFYIKSTQGGTSGDLGTISIPKSASGEQYSATLAGDEFSTFYLGASAALQFKKIQVTYTPITYYDYCTTVNQQEVEVTPDGYATFFDASKKWRLPANTTAYVGTYSDGALTLSALTGSTNIIPADKAVVLYSSTATETITLTETAQTAGTAGTNHLVGAAADITGSDLSAIEYPYVLGYKDSKTSFFKFNGETIPAGKAYLVISNYPAGAPIRFIIGEDNTATNIDSFESSDEVVKFIQNGQLFIKKNGIVYDALGRVIR